MLIEFSVENFRSIKDRVTLSMIAANLRASDPRLDVENVITASEKLSLLRSAVIYGANASGKTNLFRAFAFMKQFVRASARDGDDEDHIQVEPFRLNPNTVSAPSVFEAVFLLNDVQYRYGFSVNAERVVEEWLYFTPTIREAMLFTRDEDGIHISARFREGRDLITKTRGNALFLSVVAQFNGETASQVRRWFTGNCQILSATMDLGNIPYTQRCIQEARYDDEIQSLVRRLDLDITGLVVVERHVSGPDFAMPGDIDNSERGGERASSPRSGLSGTGRKELRAHHNIHDDSGKITGVADFSVDDMESGGTRKLIAFAGPIIDTLARGLVLFADEIDARLHPLMTTALMRLFNSTEANPKNAQLICATHDTNLLDRRQYRRDQIYFVEKDEMAATRLFSLADFKLDKPKGGSRTVRNDASFERDYIQGRYGAIPYIGDLNNLLVEELQRRDPLEPAKKGLAGAGSN